MDTLDVIRSQYKASLEMLNQAILKCPESIWDDPVDKTKFWRIAYHTLFYVHLYLQGSEQEFVPWEKHCKDYQYLGTISWDSNRQPKIGEPFTKGDLLDYLDLCLQQVDEKTQKLILDAESGFAWLPFNKLELQIYNIRHIQQHTGELMERLGSRAAIDLDWIGMKY
jgi:hypothetical protein